MSYYSLNSWRRESSGSRACNVFMKSRMSSFAASSIVCQS